MSAELPHEAPEVLSHLSALAVEVCRAHGLGEREAEAAARDMVERIKADFRGQQIYIPMEHQADRAARNAAIYESWRQGVKPGVLARRFGLSLQTVRAAISEQKARHSSASTG